MTPPHSLSAHWFDGQHGTAHPVTVSLEEGQLRFGEQLLPLQQVQWPERFRHGQRQVQLGGHGLLRFLDAAAFDAWADAHGLHPGWVERWQLSWKLALMSLALITVCFSAAWRWGLPWASAQIVERVPAEVERQIGEQTAAFVDKNWLQPTALSDAEQSQWRLRFHHMLGQAREAGLADVPKHLQLNFRRGAVGANAFALPGGHLYVTDELINLLRDDPDAVMTVLAHEVGHARHRHGMRHGVRSVAVTALASLWLGDFSSLLNGVPILIASRAYSRDFEREADAYGRDLARRGGVDPSHITVFYQRIREKYGQQPESGIAIAFSTHPADSERIAFFTKPEGSPAPKN